MHEKSPGIAAIESRFACRAFLILVGIDLFWAALYCFDGIVSQYFWKLHLLLDMEEETSFQTWYSSLQIFSVAALWALLALRPPEPLKSRSWPLWILACIFAFLSADEIVQLHEFIGYRLMPQATRAGTAFWYTGIWGFVLGPALLFCVLTLGYHIRPLLGVSPRITLKLLSGVLVFVIAAALLDEVANLAGDQGIAHHVQVIAEELGEMLGISLIFWGTLELVFRRGFWLIIPPQSPSKKAPR